MFVGLEEGCADDQVKMSSLCSFCCPILVGFPGLLQYADYSSWLGNHSPGESGVFGKSSIWSRWMLLPGQPGGHRFTHYHDWWSGSSWLGWVFCHFPRVYVLLEHVLVHCMCVFAWSQRRLCSVLLYFSVPRKQDILFEKISWITFKDIYISENQLGVP